MKKEEEQWKLKPISTLYKLAGHKNHRSRFYDRMTAVKYWVETEG